MIAVRLTPSTSGTPDLTADVPGWYFDAKCADAAPDLFFASDPEPALAVCAACPVVDYCRDYAADQGLTVGVWGGLSAEDRRDLRRASNAA